MNQSKFVKVFDSLVNVVGSKEATRIAIQVANKGEPKPIGSTVTRAPVAGSVKSRVMAFCDKHKGSVWTLQNCARQLGIDPNIVSPQLTKLIKVGYITRTGAGEYRKVY